MLVWFQKCWSDRIWFFPEEARISCGECLGNWIVTWNIPESELVDTKEGSNSRSQSAVWVFRIENPGIENQNLPTFYHLPRASFSFWGAAASRILRIIIMRTDRIIDIYRIFWRVYRKNLPRTFLRASDLQRSFWRSAYDAMANNLVRWNEGERVNGAYIPDRNGRKSLLIDWESKNVKSDHFLEIRPTLVKSDQLSWNQTNKKTQNVYVSLLSSQSCTTAWIQNIRVKRGTLFTV